MFLPRSIRSILMNLTLTIEVTAWSLNSKAKPRGIILHQYYHKPRVLLLPISLNELRVEDNKLPVSDPPVNIVIIFYKYAIPEVSSMCHAFVAPETKIGHTHRNPTFL
ncbi:hypothetical protein PILCRDRAFT_93582 [Piloderma croceum F 1598]|uniref:Uncharacterized protein n=1 Tax=Piloderma croceum (strain F 1598) TaxID=765440 RepID=A0A0C3B4E9_PILCF|nr:hypothetical protein PILCRDRAFT_93582 [Piloderma croceum F 1598]